MLLDFLIIRGKMGFTFSAAVVNVKTDSVQLTGRSTNKSLPSNNETRQPSRSFVVVIDAVAADDAHGTRPPAPPAVVVELPPRRVHLALMNRISRDIT